jgi:hypothetical protein
VVKYRSGRGKLFFQWGFVAAFFEAQGNLIQFNAHLAFFQKITCPKKNQQWASFCFKNLFTSFC